MPSSHIEKAAANRYAAIDSHVDLLYDLQRHHQGSPLHESKNAWVNLERLSAGNIRIIVSVVYCKDAWNGPKKSVEHLRSLLGTADRTLGALETVSSRERLAACYTGTGNPGALLLLENADALVEYPAENLRNRGFRVVGLTHVGKNRVGDGNAVEHPEGLSPAGRRLVRELDHLGFAIDTAHLSEPCFFEVANIFSGPLISSHTGIRSFHDIPRNLSREQMQTIVDRGGVIGVAGCPEILSADGQADLGLVFRHIDRVVQTFGPLAVGIGSDFGGYDSTCHGFEDHSRFPDLAEMMVSAGYPGSSITDIMGGNWFRFFSGLLG